MLLYICYLVLFDKNGACWINIIQLIQTFCIFDHILSLFRHTSFIKFHYTFFLICHTDSVHDAWAFWSSQTYKNHDDIFAPGEWMWADSSYPLETWSIGLFKKPINGQLNANQRTFNYWVSKAWFGFYSKVYSLALTWGSVICVVATCSVRATLQRSFPSLVYA